MGGLHELDEEFTIRSSSLASPGIVDGVNSLQTVFRPDAEFPEPVLALNGRSNAEAKRC